MVTSRSNPSCTQVYLKERRKALFLVLQNHKHFVTLTTMTTDNSNFTNDFLSELKNHKSLSTMGDVVGLPDAEDKARIQRYLVRYEQQHPGEIQAIRLLARQLLYSEDNVLKQDKSFTNKDHGIVNKGANGRVLFELPEGIGRWLDQAYPLMFRDKKHTAWFARNFKELLVPESY